MTETPADDQPGFAAEEPEHCHDCHRFIRPGQTYYLTIEQAVVFPDCVGAAEPVRLGVRTWPGSHAKLDAIAGMLGQASIGTMGISPRILDWRPKNPAPCLEAGARACPRAEVNSPWAQTVRIYSLPDVWVTAL
jgi:hypothetical protein